VKNKMSVEEYRLAGNARAKYGNRKITVSGEGTFDSKKEYDRWCELLLLERTGRISCLQRQKKFEIIPAQRSADGKLLEQAAHYTADFSYGQDGVIVVEDVKSTPTKTRDYVLRRKLMLQIHGIRIREI